MIVFVGVLGVAEGLLLWIAYVVVDGIAADDTITLGPVAEAVRGSFPRVGIDDELAIVETTRAPGAMLTLANVESACLFDGCSVDFCVDGGVFICGTPGNLGVVLMG